MCGCQQKGGDSSRAARGFVSVLFPWALVLTRWCTVGQIAAVDPLECSTRRQPSVQGIRIFYNGQPPAWPVFQKEAPCLSTQAVSCKLKKIIQNKGSQFLCYRAPQKCKQHIELSSTEDFINTLKSLHVNCHSHRPQCHLSPVPSLQSLLVPRWAWRRRNRLVLIFRGKCSYLNS